jgi:hypothetical protein
MIAVDNESPQVFVEHRDNWIEQLLPVIEQYKLEKKREHVFGERR